MLRGWLHACTYACTSASGSALMLRDGCMHALMLVLVLLGLHSCFGDGYMHALMLVLVLLGSVLMLWGWLHARTSL